VFKDHGSGNGNFQQESTDQKAKPRACGHKEEGETGRRKGDSDVGLKRYFGPRKKKEAEASGGESILRRIAPT